MTERDWLDYDDMIQRMFKAIKPRIRLFVDKTGRVPSAEDIGSMAKVETEMLRWAQTYSETSICKKLGGYHKYWKSNLQRLEPIVTEYANGYLNTVKQRDILSASVIAIITAQMNEKGIEYTITPLKTQLRLMYKASKYKNRIVNIHYMKFMNDPDVSKYLQLQAEN